jgi:hypothetical protein
MSDATIVTKAEDTALKKLWWYERRSISWGYTAHLVFWFSLFFWALMLIPYVYDQLNRVDFEDARHAGTLAIRESHSETPTEQERKLCAARMNIICTDFQILSARKVIALDYIEKLDNASKLDVGQFLKSTFIAYILAALLLSMGDRYLATSPVRSFLLLVTVFFGVVLYVGLVEALPHKNIKFYFSMGSVYALLLPTMDYLHRTRALILVPEETPPHARLEMMRLAYTRWSQGLGVGMALAVTLVASVSFNIISYLTVTFGDSFTFYPLLGIIFALAIALAGFLWGVLRCVYHILLEIEADVSQLAL